MAQISIPNARALLRGTAHEALDDAEAIALAGNYLGWARDDVDVLRETLVELERAVTWNDACATEGLRQSILATAQAVSEQAATFGYLLIAEIADSLLAVLSDGAPRLSPIEDHLSALGKAIALGLKGNGGAVGAELITRLPH